MALSQTLEKFQAAYLLAHSSLPGLHSAIGCACCEGLAVRQFESNNEGQFDILDYQRLPSRVLPQLPRLQTKHLLLLTTDLSCDRHRLVGTKKLGQSNIQSPNSRVAIRTQFAEVAVPSEW